MRNLVQSRAFSGKLKKTLNAYHNRAISTMEVIEEETVKTVLMQAEMLFADWMS